MWSFDATEGIIKLDVVVTDTSGRPVSGLEPKDFTLLDNGQQEKIVAFHAFDGSKAKPDPPVEVILVIDELNLTSAQLSRVEQGVRRFLLQNGGDLAQPVTIYRLSTRGTTVTRQPSTDGKALVEEMAHKNELRSILPLYNEFYWMTVQQAEAGANYSRNLITLNSLGAMILEERRRPGRKLMVWLGGG